MRRTGLQDAAQGAFCGLLPSSPLLRPLDCTVPPERRAKRVSEILRIDIEVSGAGGDGGATGILKCLKNTVKITSPFLIVPKSMHKENALANYEYR